MEIPFPAPIVSVRELLPLLGFAPRWGTMTDREPSFEFRGGGITVSVVEVMSLYLRPEFMISGVVNNGRTLGTIEQSIPLKIESIEQLKAWLAFAVGPTFATTSSVGWLDEGRSLQALLPWEQARRRFIEAAEERERQRKLRPHCRVGRRWLRQLLNAVAREVGPQPAPGRFAVHFDGEMLKFYICEEVLGVPAKGDPWPHRVSGVNVDLMCLPKRLSVDPIEVGLWNGRMEIERLEIPVD